MAGLSIVDPALIPEDLPDWIEAFNPVRRFGGPVPGQAAEAFYAIVDGGQTPFDQPYRPVTEAERETILTALARLTEDTGLRLVEAPTQAEAQMLIGVSSVNEEGYYGRTLQASATPVEVVMYDTVYDTPETLARNSYIFLHELLHGVGLDHSTEVFRSTHDVVIPAEIQPGTTLFGSWSGAPIDQLQLFDLAAMQYLYGPDPEQRAGDDTYGAPQVAFDPQARDETAPLIWDGGGRDRIDLSAAVGPAVASLAPGVLSRVNTDSTNIRDAGTFAINHGTVIEELIGTAHGDQLTGSEGADTLQGRDGDDLLIGGRTAEDLRDVLLGGAGNDTIDGGYGNDALRGDAGDDLIAGGFGADTVIGGTGNDSLTGAALGDELFGSDGDDFINGGFGYDRVNGGTGADRFFHLGIFDHGSDWIQDYTATEGDTLVFGRSGATAAQFQVNTTFTEGAGDAGVAEAFVIHRPSGQILWALVDGAGEDRITLVLEGQSFDLPF